MDKNYTVRYRLTIRGILTGGDMKVIAPTKHHAIELVRHLINIDCIQTHFDDVHLDCQVVDESEDPLTILLKEKREQ
jgi:hypothetical protein